MELPHKIGKFGYTSHSPKVQVNLEEILSFYLHATLLIKGPTYVSPIRYLFNVWINQ